MHKIYMTKIQKLDVGGRESREDSGCEEGRDRERGVLVNHQCHGRSEV